MTIDIEKKLFQKYLLSKIDNFTNVNLEKKSKITNLLQHFFWDLHFSKEVLHRHGG